MLFNGTSRWLQSTIKDLQKRIWTSKVLERHKVFTLRLVFNFNRVDCTDPSLNFFVNKYWFDHSYNGKDLQSKFMDWHFAYIRVTNLKTSPNEVINRFSDQLEVRKMMLGCCDEMRSPLSCLMMTSRKWTSITIHIFFYINFSILPELTE